MAYLALVTCANDHETTTPMHHPTVLDDGTVEGACGSDAHYCRLCGAPANVTAVTEVDPCTSCRIALDPLAAFPGGICVSCYAASPAGQRMPTAADVITAWGGTP